MKLIVACDPKGGIGYKNKLPWDKIQGDLPRFKKLTDGKIVVMGRNTWESLPKKPLPNRTNYVITNDPFSIPYVMNKEIIFATNNMEIFSHFTDEACVIGGAKIIELTWSLINEIHLTKVLAEYTCDTFIDLIKLENEFTLQSEEKLIDHTYQIWKRK